MYAVALSGLDCAMKVLPLYICAAVVPCLLAGCGGGAAVSQQARGGSGFSLRTLEESFAMGGQASFSMELEETEDSAQLRIIAEDVQQLTHAYLEIGYDAAQWTAEEADSAGLLGEEAISLLAGNQAGIVQYGELVPGSRPVGVNNSGILATIEFRRGAERPRETMAAEVAAPRPQRNPSWDILSWYLENTGDYDQNGIVNISDLTPLGVNLGKQVPDDEGSLLYQVDGDGNGLISLADITPIGQNFGNSLEGYNLYAAPDGSGSGRLVASLQLADAESGPGERKSFRLTDNAVELHDRYWLRAKSGSQEGPAGPLSDEWQKDWQRTVIHSQSELPV